MSEASPRALLFVHVRKTGGTTLTRAIGNRFAARDCLSLYGRPVPADHYLDEYRYITGNVDISLLERFRRRPYVITCLRDPIERSLSTYSYYRWFPPRDYEILLPQLGPAAYERRVAAMQLARQMSLPEFLRQAPALAVEHLGNLQTRILCGSGDEGGEERLGVALEELARCDFIALTERLDESAGWLARRLGWREFGAMPRANVTADRLTRERLPPETLAALEELTTMDAELHRAAVQLYDQRIAAWDGTRDATVNFPDATPVPDLSFSEPMAGAGWWGRERVGDGPWFSWIGDTRAARVDLAPRRGVDRVVVEIEHVIERSVLDSLTIRVNGEPTEHELRSESGTVVASAPVSDATVNSPHAVRIGLEVAKTARPCDLDPASSDARRLSIAVRRIALERSR